MRPPRLATWLLAQWLDPADRHEVLGDLAEDFTAQLAAHGVAAARRWYWLHALRLCWSLGVRVRAGDGPMSRLLVFDELRYAVRRLARQPVTTAMSVCTLAMAAGAAVATWTLLSATVLRPVNVADPSRLLVLGGQYRTSPAGADTAVVWGLSYPAFEAVQSSGLFAEVAGNSPWSEQVGIAGVPADRKALFVSSNFFRALGRPMQAGRDFSPADDRRGAPLTVILSDALWRASLGASLGALGRSIAIHDTTATVVGVAPAEFHGLDLAYTPEIYLPLNVIADVTPPQLDWFDERVSTKMATGAWVRVVGRLRPTESAAKAAAQMAAMRGLGPAGSPFGVRDGTLRGIDVDSASLGEHARADLTRFVRLIATTVALLLTIGCLAVGTLLLLRTESRRDELVVCVALGASRGRLAAGIVAEGLLVAGLGAALAVPLSASLLAGLRQFRLPGGVAMDALRVQVDAGTLVTAAVAALFATTVMALISAGVGLSAGVADSLRSRAGVTPSLERQRTRRALVVATLAVSLVLLSGAGLFARSVAAALALDPGYDISHLLTAAMTVSPTGRGLTAPRFDELRDRLLHSPVIRSASIETSLGSGTRVMIDGRERTLAVPNSTVGIDDAYFSTIGLTVTPGRNFGPVDQTSGPPVGIASASFARVFGPGDRALGHHVQIFRWFGEPPYNVEIVGVVPDIIDDVTALTPSVLYVPSALLTRFPNRKVVIRSAGDVTVAAREARALVTAMSPTTPPPTFTTLEESLAQQMGPQRLGATVMGALGLIAALLTLFGIYVLVQSAVTLRRREFGVRAALGATGRELGALVVREVLLMTGAGLVAGLALTGVAAGLIRTFLFGVGPLDAVTLSLVAAGLVVLALAVSVRPVLTIGRGDLAQILREP